MTASLVATEKPTRVCWSVEIRSMTCIVFAETNEKARWIAVKAYWDAFGKDGSWPGASARREPQHDNHSLRDGERRAWSPDYL